MAKPAELWLSHQQGGTSKEWYVHFYYSKEDAEHGIKEIKAASYDACGPYQVPEVVASLLLANPRSLLAFTALIETIVLDAFQENFSNLEPDDNDDDAEDEEDDDADPQG